MRLFRPPLIAMILAIAFCGGTFLLSDAPRNIPARETFALFPLRFETWQGETEQLSPRIVDALKVQDYFLANFRSTGRPEWVNFYVAYYDRQLLGSAAHSPRTCIPGDGWEINELSVVNITVRGLSLAVNRVIVS